MSPAMLWSILRWRVKRSDAWCGLLVTCTLHINWSSRGEMEENGAEVDEYVTYLFSLGVGMCKVERLR